MQGLFDWLLSLPLAALYATLGVVAAIENVFPPIPADTIVALGSFLAARGHGSVVGAFLATWIGNVAGAMVTYSAGRRYGAERLERRLMGDKAGSAQARLQNLYGRFGIAALFFSRFIPGIRAIVPPFAGALRVPPLRAGIAIALASGIWYGLVSYLGYTVGADWPRLVALIKRDGALAAMVAAVLALAIGVVWWLRARRDRGAAGTTVAAEDESSRVESEAP